MWNILNPQILFQQTSLEKKILLDRRPHRMILSLALCQSSEPRRHLWHRCLLAQVKNGPGWDPIEAYNIEPEKWCFQYAWFLLLGSHFQFHIVCFVGYIYIYQCIYKFGCFATKFAGRCYRHWKTHRNSMSDQFISETHTKARLRWILNITYFCPAQSRGKVRKLLQISDSIVVVENVCV